MFKKTKIAAVSAAVLGLSSMTAQAVSLNEAGSEGSVLVFPYYNVNNGFVTSYNLINTTDAYKALKVRFRESENSNDVLDFNVYLSPQDVFTMMLKEGSDGGVNLTTTDRSCTQPAIPASGVLFRHTAYTSTSTMDVREGYLEVIEMGEVPASTTVTFPPSATAVTVQSGLLHAQPSGIPANCAVIEQAWIQGAFKQGGAASNTAAIDLVNPKSPGYPFESANSAANFYGQSGSVANTGLTSPKGGMVGSSILVDTINVVGFVAEPASIRNYQTTTAQHYLSSDQNFYLLPSLASGNVPTSERASTDGVAAPVTATYGTVARDFGLDDQKVLPRTSVPSGINPMPVSDALLVTQVGNQYFLGPNTLTDYVITAPMRKHAIYNDYQYVSSGTGYSATTATLPNGDIVGDIPVGGKIGDATATGAYWDYLGVTNDDVNASVIYYNREEGKDVPTPGDFSPPIVTVTPEVPLIREVNILSLVKTLGTPESVLGSKNARQLLVIGGFDNGFVQLSFANAAYDLAGNPRYVTDWTAAALNGSSAAITAKGVPLIGFMASRSAIAGGNVGETFPHFYQKAY
ncbi:MAG: hypothetical protein HOE45_04395 [Gammaproteobacteria bacterium]|jgi:hypothetical protein|nr:hypothetical protein [Gammaproteobacteria bacterium]MBT5223314.1 hypothetical protein [Gammaproteobacteria bacterium]MBT5827026.1 hypothetical protein [Gammaproteobacteria bacterium]MBT5967153.1 hypothetical protein [Gammaproteobacteria bacterium]MBT6420032.1 hypothetical protein [Gammaproteobacteria bacterium]